MHTVASESVAKFYIMVFDAIGPNDHDMPMLERTVIRCWIVGIALGLGGCVVDLGLSSKIFSCQTDADCPGMSCHPVHKVCFDASTDLRPFEDTNAEETSSPVDTTPPADTTPPVDTTPPTDTNPAPDLPPSKSPCEEYCDAIAADCVGEDAQYESVADCLSFCEEVDSWGSSKSEANSLQCRLNRLALVTD